MRGIGVGSPEKLAAAHLDNDRTPDTLKMAGLGAVADAAPSEDPLRKIPEGSLPRSNHPLKGYGTGVKLRNLRRRSYQ